MSATQVFGGFFNRIGNIVSNTDQLLEGAFWGSWCGLNVYNWTAARKEKQETESLPESDDKAKKLWLANKKTILSSFSIASGVSMVTSWMEEVKLISLGSLSTFVACLGFGGSSLVSFSKIWDGLCELDQEIKDFFNTDDPRAKKHIALSQLETLVKVAFFACLAAWGVFGALHAAIGGAALFLAMDASLYYAFILFLGYIATAITVPILKKMT